MRQPTFYAGLSIVTSLVTIVLKFSAYYVTGSVGLLSDAIEACVNIAAALVAYRDGRYAEALRAFAVILMIAAGLSVFIALYTALEERRYDLAVMRTLGASPGRLFGLLLM